MEKKTDYSRTIETTIHISEDDLVSMLVKAGHVSSALKCISSSLTDWPIVMLFAKTEWTPDNFSTEPIRADDGSLRTVVADWINKTLDEANNSTSGYVAVDRLIELNGELNRHFKSLPPTRRPMNTAFNITDDDDE